MNSSLLIGVSMALGGVLMLTAMDALAKVIVSGELHVMQVLALRSAIIGLGLHLWYRTRGQLQQLRPVNRRAQWLRGLGGSVAPVCFFSALIYLPLTDATIIGYNGVFMMTIMSAVFLGERVGPWRWMAVVAGYSGVLVAIQWQGDGHWPGYVLVFLASVAYSGMAIAGKWLSRTETTASMVSVYNLCVGLVAVLWLPWVWQSMNIVQFTMILAFGAMAFAGQSLMVNAYRRLDASSMAPLEYTSLVYVVLFDLILFNHLPTLRVFLGAAMVIAAGLFVLHRERLRAAQSVA